jgi:hypothetical protein
VLLLLLNGDVLVGGDAIAGNAKPASWATGERFRSALNTVFPNVYWVGNPLRQAVENLAESQRVAVLIDRRIDPDRKLELKLESVSLEQVLKTVAQRSNAAVSIVAPVVYLGPPEAARRLRTLALLRRSEIQALHGDLAQSLGASSRLGWSDFDTPRAILKRLAETSGVPIRGLERVPHDLWAGVELPSLPLADRITLIAIQFDLTFKVDQERGEIVLVPIPDEVAIQREYSVGKESREQAAQWERAAPGAVVRVAGDKVVVRGTAEDHEKIAALRRPTPRPRPKPAAAAKGEKRYTLNSKKGPLDQMLKQLTGMLGLELRVDRQSLEEAGISLSQPVSFNVKDGTIEDLFEALLSPVGCDFRRDGNVIEVFPARREPPQTPE